MKLYSITDGYIDYLIKSYPHVYSNKENRRTHERKYIGAVLDFKGLESMHDIWLENVQ